jgi:hypothetical protein
MPARHCRGAVPVVAPFEPASAVATPVGSAGGLVAPFFPRAIPRDSPAAPL